jgi:hypothetical protein
MLVFTTCSRSLRGPQPFHLPRFLSYLLPQHHVIRRSARSTLTAESPKRGYNCASAAVTSPKKMAVQQPEWTLPASKMEEPVLKVYNSLTRTKVRLVPRPPFPPFAFSPDSVLTVSFPKNNSYITPVLHSYVRWVHAKSSCLIPSMVTENETPPDAVCRCERTAC